MSVNRGGCFCFMFFLFCFCANQLLHCCQVEMLLRSFDERRLHRVTKAKDTQLMKSVSVTADNISQPASPADLNDHK